MENKKYKHSFDYIGSYVADKHIIPDDVVNHAFSNLNEGAFDNRNKSFDFSKGNLFEFLEGAKIEFKNAQLGNELKKSPVNAASENGLPQTPDDIRYLDANGNNVIAQLKTSQDADWIIRQFSSDEYKGMQRWCPSDMYDEVKTKLMEKANDGTITPMQQDALKNLVKTNTTNKEILSLGGEDGKVDLLKVNQYIETQRNKLFIDECIENTTAVTLSSALFGCVFSSITNLYKYFTDKEDLNVALKNIGKDTIKSTGHGLLSSSIANCFKYIGYETGNTFLRNGVNSLVIANGAINVCKSAVAYKKGKISLDNLLSNIMGSSALTLVNLGLNFLVPGHAFIKLGMTIIMHQLINGLMHHDNDTALVPESIENQMANTLISEANDTNLNLSKEMLINYNIFDCIKKIINDDNLDINDSMLKKLFEDLNITDAYDTYNKFIDELDDGKIIEIKF